MTIAYRVMLEPDDNDTLFVTCRSLPEITTFGDDEADALRRARGAIEEALAARIAEGHDIPKGSASGPHLVRLPASTSRKVDLHRQMRNAHRVSKSENGNEQEDF
jgi:antitoxin HicB